MESESDPIHGADLIRIHIESLPPGTALDAGDLALQFGLTKGYVYDLLHQLINVSVWQPERGQFARIVSDLPVVPSGEVWSSMQPHETNPNRPGSGRRIWHRRASE